MSSYDQWITASPYDDEPDIIEEAEKWLKRNESLADNEDVNIRDAYWVIHGLRELIKEEIGL